MVLKADAICQCLAHGVRCKRKTWALPGDGLHSYKFEFEKGNEWGVKKGESSKIKKEDEEEFVAKSVEEIRGTKKM